VIVDRLMTAVVVVVALACEGWDRLRDLWDGPR
jgi:hypothetical protein